MKRDRYHRSILKGGRRVVSRDGTSRFWRSLCWVLFGLFLMGELGDRPAGAAGLDLIWTRSEGTAQSPLVAFSPDGKIVASGGPQQIHLWRSTDGTLLGTLPGGTVAPLVFSPDGQLLATSSREGKVQVWRMSDGTVLHTLPLPYAALGLAFTAGGQQFATVNKDDKILLWRVSDGSPLLTLWSGDKGGFYPYLTSSPDGQYLALGARNTELWRVSDGKLLFTIPNYRSWMVAFSRDSQILASTSTDAKKVYLWQVADGGLLHTLTGHKYWVFSAAFSTDGKLLITSSNDVQTAGKRRGEINFWSVEDGKLLRSYDPGAGVRSLALSPDDLYLTYGLEDGSVVVARNPYAPGQ